MKEEYIMEYRLIGTSMPALHLTLNYMETIYAQRGAMVWMSNQIVMDTGIQGGLIAGISRKIKGESFFVSTFSACSDNAYLALAPNTPGEIAPVELKGMPLVCQKKAFLCAEENIKIKTIFTKKMSVGIFGGEGFILQQMSGEGMLFLEADGNLHIIELDIGEELRVNTGNVVAFEKTVDYNIELVKGKNLFFGGEGVFLTLLKGPGRVYLQTMNFMSFINNRHLQLSEK